MLKTASQGPFDAQPRRYRWRGTTVALGQPAARRGHIAGAAAERVSEAAGRCCKSSVVSSGFFVAAIAAFICSKTARAKLVKFQLVLPSESETTAPLSAALSTLIKHSQTCHW